MNTILCVVALSVIAYGVLYLMDARSAETGSQGVSGAFCEGSEDDYEDDSGSEMSMEQERQLWRAEARERQLKEELRKVRKQKRTLTNNE
ncbi:hypothetical protein QB910_000003 [Dabrowskivirus KKP3916]|uniref:Uncharacterized protein n=1 Tax=Alicyclobacillus phage KKP_3916 TaxID=3040651 RepID=A0AAT9V7T9_9CAUD|nr:hypothetical protein QB910_000003 [Alicyclobacillus phage KKP 3916]